MGEGTNKRERDSHISFKNGKQMGEDDRDNERSKLWKFIIYLFDEMGMDLLV